MFHCQVQHMMILDSNLQKLLEATVSEWIFPKTNNKESAWAAVPENGIMDLKNLSVNCQAKMTIIWWTHRMCQSYILFLLISVRI